MLMLALFVLHKKSFFVQNIDCNYYLSEEKRWKMKEREDEKTAMDTYDERLQGTFVSVISIGIFILITWFLMFNFYLTLL